MVPSRPEMERGLAAFAEQVPVPVRYGCRWESTRREDDGRLVLTTSDGEYRCTGGRLRARRDDALVLAHPRHRGRARTTSTRGRPQDYRGRRVFVIGKRNSGFEIADGLLPGRGR